MELSLNYSGKNDHNLKFRGNGVGHYPIRSSSPINSTKYFFLHNFQGILKLRGWWCLNSRQSISERCRNKICFRKTKIMSLYCPTLSDITFHGKHWRMLLSVLFIPAGFNGLIGIWMVSRKSMIKNSGLKKKYSTSKANEEMTALWK